MVEVSEKRLNYLRQWRAARKLERELAYNGASGSEDRYMDEAQGEALGLELKPFTRQVCAGDVRLLSDDLTTHAALPRYVAVLTTPRDGIAVCATFSRYLVPATKDEWLTGLKSPCLRVLQLWNAQPAAVSCIAQSWKVASLDENRLSRALALYRHSVNHTLPDENEREDIGVAIVSEKDERNDYMADEYAEFSPLFSSSVEVFSQMNSIFDRVVGMRASAMFEEKCMGEYALAAADERRNPFAKGVIEGTTVGVAVEYETEKKLLRIKLRNDVGAHEGWSVWISGDADPLELGIVENGILVVRDVDTESIANGFVLASPDGKNIARVVPNKGD